MSSVAPAAPAVSPASTYQPIVLLISRILLASIFLVAGTRKLMAVAGTAAYFAKLGMPMADVMVWVAIIVEIGGGLMLVAGWKARYAAWALAIFTLIAAFTAHRFWEVADAAQYGNQMNHFLKNLGIIGGMMMVAACGPGPMSVDKN